MFINFNTNQYILYKINNIYSDKPSFLFLFTHSKLTIENIDINHTQNTSYTPTKHHSLQGSQSTFHNMYSIESSLFIQSNHLFYFYIHIYNKLLRTLTQTTHKDIKDIIYADKTSLITRFSFNLSQYVLYRINSLPSDKPSFLFLFTHL